MTGGIKVIYTRLGDKADHVIMEMIKGDRREWIVITSDRQIADYAWSHGSVPVASEQFMARLAHAGGIADGEYEELDETVDTVRRKGTSRQLSKKERSLSKAIRKL